MTRKARKRIGLYEKGVRGNLSGSHRLPFASFQKIRRRNIPLFSSVKIILFFVENITEAGEIAGRTQEKRV